MQNIPSHNKEIRMMFKATDGYSLVGGDYSQQEPRIMAQFAQDENMINAYKEKKDLYATVASKVHNNGYWDNMEHYEDGSPNPDGKKRRGAIKSVVLGILYGSGPATVAEQITNGRREKDGSIKPENICSVEEAQSVIDKFYKGFPKVKAWIDYNQKSAKEKGYVEDLWGRRRRLPDIQLPPIDIKTKDNNSKFNPLLYVDPKFLAEKPKIVAEYEKKFSQCKTLREINAVKSQAIKEGLTIIDNGGFISRAERQCTNARVQGSAATMSKRAMLAVYRDEILKELGFRLLIVVHDELIGECPTKNADKVSSRLTELMLGAALPLCTIPMKCDIEITSKWYETDYADLVRKEFKENLNSGLNKEEAIQKICNERIESTKQDLINILF